MVRILAPAKVNLFLRILAREDSGYHQLETLFAGVELADAISLEEKGRGISLESEGADLGPPEANLAYRAAAGFLELTGRDVGVRIRLAKRIPLQGGLGGGSSDAAATLKALSVLFPGLVEPQDLLALAGRLGSDVPFFLAPSPFAMAWGRGDRLLTLPSLPRAPVLLALPPLGVPTPEAYRLLSLGRKGAASAGASRLYVLGDFGSWEGIADRAGNDFEEVIFRKYPLLGEIGRALAETRPLMSMLSGSGSSLFAVFRCEEEALEAQAHLQEELPDTRFLLTHSLEKTPDPNLHPGVEE